MIAARSIDTVLIATSTHTLFVFIEAAVAAGKSVLCEKPLDLDLARAVYFGAKVLILDEPTSALGVRQTSNVLATIDKVRTKAIGVVFISHNVRHALAVGDRFTVLNRGKTLGTALRGDITPEQLQDMMAGGQEMAQLEGSLGGTV